MDIPLSALPAILAGAAAMFAIMRGLDWALGRVQSGPIEQLKLRCLTLETKASVVEAKLHELQLKMAERYVTADSLRGLEERIFATLGELRDDINGLRGTIMNRPP